MNDYENENSVLVHSEDVCNIDSVIVCGTDVGHVGAVSLIPDHQNAEKECCSFLWKNELRGTGAHIPCIKFDSPSNTVFVGIKGRIYAFNPITGQRKWKIHPKSQQGFMIALSSAWTDVLISREQLYYTQSGRVMKINFNGHIEWDVDLHLGSKYAVCTLAISKLDDLIFVGVKRTVICVNTSSGDILWKTKLPNEGWGGISMATNSTQYLCAAVDGVVYSLKYANGEIVSHKEITGAGKIPVGLACDPSDDNIFYATCGKQLIGMNMEEGSLMQLWTSAIKKKANYSLPVLVHTEGKLTKAIIVASSSHIRSFDPSTGTLLWNTSLKNSFVTRSFPTMVHLNDSTLVCATPNHLLGVNKNSGEIEWEDKMKGWLFPRAMFLATARHSMDWSAQPVMHAMYHTNMDSTK